MKEATTQVEWEAAENMSIEVNYFVNADFHLAAILFFYGSLKRGYSNHRRIADQKYLGDAVTLRCYRIIDLGEYGGMIRDEHGLAVKGELWAIDSKCLAELDEFEMSEGGFARMPVSVEGREGVQSYCWTGVVPEGAVLKPVS